MCRYGWSASVQLSQDEREEQRRKEFFRKQEEIKNRQEKLKSFIEMMRNFFQGSSIESEAEELIHTWQKQKLNKELVYANIQVQKMISDNERTLLDSWNSCFSNFNGGNY